uniref:SH3 domain containing 19 n=1 Tax=Gadus morhua TaxID=8049 RepID=A0A8C5BIC3_GADMO
SQGPLSSIRAAIKRWGGNGVVCVHRRPEITILSAEPLANSSWFPGASGIFNSPPAPPPPPPAPESSWPGSVQADPQVHQVYPSSPIRGPKNPTVRNLQEQGFQFHIYCALCFQCSFMIFLYFAVKKPQKPPRPSLLKTQCREPTIVKSEPTNIQCTNVSIGTENQNDSKSCIEQRNTKESKHTCSRSVTVQWDGSAKDLIQHIKVPVNSQSPPADFSTPSSEPEPVECPIPLPRLKKYHRKPLTEEVSVSVQTLVSLSDNVEDNQVNSSNNQEELSSNKYIEQLLEVFGADNSSLENDKASESNSTEQSTEADDKMSAMHSQREVSARIAAFETKPSTEEETAAQRPKPLPRNASIKPPVSSKPSIASRASFKHSRENNNNNNVMPPKPLVASRPQKPSPAPRPQHALQPGGYPSIGGPQDMMPSKGPVLPSARLSIKAKVKGLEQQLQQENCVLTPPVPGEKPFKEPLLPNLNLNNHNSTFMVLPPRPPPAKVGPARPPQPGHSAPGRASLGPASQRGAQSAAPVQRPGRRGPALPPRPRPGHRLYNQYTVRDITTGVYSYTCQRTITQDLCFVCCVHNLILYFLLK